jgi:GNAT superfamily N-acetyltransferase
VTLVLTTFGPPNADDARQVTEWEELVDDTYRLWNESLGESWPLDRAFWERYVGTGTVAREDDRLVGLVLHDRQPHRGSIRAIVVAPDRRRAGIGTTLMRQAMRQIRGSGHGTGGMRPAPAYVTLGGGHRYIWPGIPDDLAASRAFFEPDWQFGDPCYDMRMSLPGFLPPGGCLERVAAAGVSFRAATAEDMPRIIAFEDAEFPDWTRYFREHAPEDIVIGVEGNGAIVAALVLDMPPILWWTLLGRSSAEIGAVGVASSRRNEGLGTALVARACEILLDRSVEVAVLRWLYRVHFYGRVGFEVWKEYLVASKTFSHVNVPSPLK